MARDNPTWGEERIAAELLVKLGIRVSPRTVRRYTARGPGERRRGAANQRWATFVRNHAQAVVACDFSVAVTVTFRVLYVFVALEVGSRRLVHINVTSHPTAAWTLQQFREVLAEVHAYRFVHHARDSIYAPWLDAAVTALGVRVLRTPVHCAAFLHAVPYAESESSVNLWFSRVVVKAWLRLGFGFLPTVFV